MIRITDLNDVTREDIGSLVVSYDITPNGKQLHSDVIVDMVDEYKQLPKLKYNASTNKSEETDQYHYVLDRVISFQRGRVVHQRHPLTEGEYNEQREG